MTADGAAHRGDWRRQAMTIVNELVPDGGPLRPLTVPLEIDECEWFVRGWEADLYPIAGCPKLGVKGTCGPGRLDHFLTTAGRHRHLLTRWTEGGWGLSREYVTHLAAFSRAVLEFGYLAEGSMLSHYGRYRRDLVTRRAGGSYEIDVCFPSAGDEQPLLLIEAKAEPRDIARWALAIDAGATATELIAVGFKEVEYVLELAPRHVWLVGPGTVDPARHVWAVRVDRLDVRFTRVSDVPVGVTAP